MEGKALDSLSSKMEAQLFIDEYFFHKVTLRNTKGRKEKKRKEKRNYKTSSSLFKLACLEQVNATISYPDPGKRKNEDKTWPKYQRIHGVYLMIALIWTLVYKHDNLIRRKRRSASTAPKQMGMKKKGWAILLTVSQSGSRSSLRCCG